MPPARARGKPRALALGPGYIHVTALPTPEPEDLTTPWEDVDPSWILLGYTETGSEFTYALQTGEVQVAEELDPVITATTGRTGALVFTMAEMTASHLSVAMNGGYIYWAGKDGAPPGMADDIVIVEPPDLGDEQRYKFGWESEDHQERWIFRQCFQTGTMKIVRQKGTTIAGIAVSFALEKPGAGGRLYRAIMHRENRGGWLVPAPPRITGITPASVGNGAATPVTLAGSHFTGATGVTFAGDAGTAFTVTNDAAIAVTTPAIAAAGQCPVIVTGHPDGPSAPFNLTVT